MRDVVGGLLVEIDTKIKEYTTECEMIIDLLDMPKYYNSKSLEERFKKIKLKIELLVARKNGFIQ